jgi:hypothetical protein
VKIRSLVYTGVAQLVEHWSPKPGVGSSSLSTRANKIELWKRLIISSTALLKNSKKYLGQHNQSWLIIPS